MTTPTPTKGSKFTGPMTAETAEKIIDDDVSPPLRKIAAAFNTSAGKWDQDYNLFFKLSAFTDAEFSKFNANQNLGFQRAEFRQMMGRPATQGPLSTDEIAEIKEMSAQAKEAVARNKGLDINAAESLAFAAKAAGVTDTAAFIDNLVRTDGNILGLKPDTLTKAGPFKFDVDSWLYEVKKHGAEHGLGYFADRIKVEEKTDATGKVVSATVQVDDPAVLREIVAMRNNPRLSSVMGAHIFKDGNPPPLSYNGITMSATPDAQVQKDQQALINLGFNIGATHADGFNGPLTEAAKRDFMHIQGITDPAKVSQALQDAVAEANKTAGLYIYNSKTKSWDRKEPNDKKAQRDPTAVRLDAKDGFALKIASERSGLKFNSLLNIVIAQRAFDPPGSNPGRAPGLFAMSEGAWLTTLAQSGEKYGLGDLVKQMDIQRDPQGHITNVTVRNPMVRKYMLDLRKDPRISAVMGGERALNGPIYLDIAQAWLGKTENRNKTELERFFKVFGGISHNPSGAEAGDASAWCAVFVNTLMEATGRDKTQAQTMARSFINDKYGEDVAPQTDFDRLHTLNDALETRQGSKKHNETLAQRNAVLDDIGGRVKAGDIVVFPRGDSNVLGHVTIVEECYKENGVWKIKVIGGNQGGSAADGGGVTESVRNLDEVLGIRRPIAGTQTEMVQTEPGGPRSTTPQQRTATPAARPGG